MLILATLNLAGTVLIDVVKPPDSEPDDAPKIQSQVKRYTQIIIFVYQSLKKYYNK